MNDLNREEKMKIVINNYFKKECSVNTSIREAFEKGFRIGASKVQKKHGKWISLDDFRGKYNAYGYKCSECGEHSEYEASFCPNCGALMEIENDN